MSTSKNKIIHIQKSDDITSVTEAIKQAGSANVRLVSDTGSTVLKSATNIKLVKKVADKNRKHLVFVNPHTSIKPILADLKMKASKDVTSASYLVKGGPKATEKKIILEAPSSSKPKPKLESKEDKIESSGAGSDSIGDELKKDEDKLDKLAGKKASDRGISIPNFDRFRNKTLAVVSGLILLVAVWFIAFRVLPNGIVRVRLQTDKIGVQETITISNTFSSSNFSSNQLKAQKATVEKKISKEINTTGRKNVGEKATGTVTVSNQNSSTTENFQVGTRFQSGNGLFFVADEAFSVGPASVEGGEVVPGTGIASVSAESEGDEYNLSSGADLSIENSSGSFGAEIESIGGGTTEEVEIVAQADIDDFTESLKQPADDEIDAELERQFDQTMLVLDDTSSVEVLQITSSPEVGKEASKTTVSATVTYSVFAISKDDIENLAKAKIKLDPAGGEKLYSVDSTAIIAKTTEKIENGLIVDVSISSFIGPELNEALLSDEIKGLRFSAALDALREKTGVVDAEIELSPFWINKVPGAEDLTFEFEVAEVGETSIDG